MLCIVLLVLFFLFYICNISVQIGLTFVCNIHSCMHACIWKPSPIHLLKFNSNYFNLLVLFMCCRVGVLSLQSVCKRWQAGIWFKMNAPWQNEKRFLLYFFPPSSFFFFSLLFLRITFTLMCEYFVDSVRKIYTICDATRHSTAWHDQVYFRAFCMNEIMINRRFFSLSFRWIKFISLFILS